MSLGNVVVNIFNWLISVIGTIISTLLSVLPDSPFSFNFAFDNQFLKAMNYVFPIQSAISHLSAYVMAVLIYYIFRVVMRWIKLASS